MKAMLLIITLLISLSSWANAGWATKNNSGRIKWINPEGNVVRIHFTANDLMNPANCKVSNVVILKDDTKNGDRQYAAILSAFMANKPIKFYVGGCISAWGTTYPNLTAVYLSE